MNESWEVGERLGPKRMHFCSCVSHWNAVLVCLISQYSICSNAHFRLTAAAQSRLGQQPSHCKRPTPRISGGVCRYRHYGKDTQAVVHVLERLFVGTETCLDQLVDEVHLQTVHQSSAICQYTEGRGGRMDQGNEMSIHIKRGHSKPRKCPSYPQFLCPLPECLTSAASREYLGRLPLQSKWPQTLPPHETSHAH